MTQPSYQLTRPCNYDRISKEETREEYDRLIETALCKLCGEPFIFNTKERPSRCPKCRNGAMQ